MKSDREKRALEPRTRGLPAELHEAVRAWAAASTDANSPRAHDLKRDKENAVAAFFAFAGRYPAEVRPGNVAAWRETLERAGKAPATVYAMLSRVSSFFVWAQGVDGSAVTSNPVDGVRPKAPKPYGGATVKALPFEALVAIEDEMSRRAEAGSVTALRDRVIFLLLLETELRRREVIQLRAGDVRTNGALVVHTQRKGGDYATVEVAAPEVREALIRYLEASGRAEELTAETPLFTRHDRAGRPGRQLTTHAFAGNLKRYAAAAGLDPAGVHVHALRHSRAAVVMELTGSTRDVADALGHQDEKTTRVYAPKVALKRDKFAGLVLRRLHEARAEQGRARKEKEADA